MDHLTNQQQEILRLLADGMNNREIAFVLDVSPHVMTGLVTTVLERCGLTSRQQTATYLAKQLESAGPGPR